MSDYALVVSQPITSTLTDYPISSLLTTIPIVPPSLAGYRNCDELTDLGIIWLAYPGRDMMLEVWHHMDTCELCKANKPVQDAYRLALEAWKAEPPPIAIEMTMEALNVRQMR